MCINDEHDFSWKFGAPKMLSTGAALLKCMVLTFEVVTTKYMNVALNHSMNDIHVTEKSLKMLRQKLQFLDHFRNCNFSERR